MCNRTVHIKCRYIQRKFPFDIDKLCDTHLIKRKQNVKRNKWKRWTEKGAYYINFLLVAYIICPRYVKLRKGADYTMYMIQWCIHQNSLIAFFFSYFLFFIYFFCLVPVIKRSLHECTLLTNTCFDNSKFVCCLKNHFVFRKKK